MEFNNIILSADFIKNSMVNAPSIYTLVYICVVSLKTASVFEISSFLNISKNDVYAAVMYWSERHLLKLDGEKVISTDKSVSAALEEKVQSNKFENKTKNKFISSAAPVYDQMELIMYRDKNEVIKELFKMAERVLGKTLTHADMNTVFNLYHWLGMKLETIELLLTYCVEKGHRNMRYIEVVAIDWCESGFADADDIKEQLINYNTKYRAIMKAFGQGGRNPVEAEEKYMMKWINTYNMPMELITLACEKTVMAVGKTSFSYADGIIKKWYDSNFKTVADIEASERAFIDSKKKEAEKKAESSQNYVPKTKPNSFTNYTQQKHDYSQIEKLKLKR